MRPAARRSSANAAAPSGIVAYDEPRTSPFATGRSISSTRSGIEASRAGRNTTLATSTTKASRYTHQTARISGTSAISPARRPSMTSIVVRRSQCRTARVASGPPTTAGSSRSVRIPPTAVGDPVSSSARAMNAIVPIQSPSAETP